MNGTHQGCPLSPLIFAMLMQLQAEKIQTHSNSSGIKSQGSQHANTLFPDDIILSLSNPLKKKNVMPSRITKSMPLSPT